MAACPSPGWTAQARTGLQRDERRENTGQRKDRQATGQAEQAAGSGGGEEPNATEAAKQKAQELGLDLSQVEGSGSEGRITVKDVTSAANQG